MGICSFSCALKAAEIFHIRGLLYKKGWSGLGFAGRKTALVTTAAEKSSPCFSHRWELFVCALPVTFQASFLKSKKKSKICMNQKHRPVCPWCVPGSSSPAPVSFVTVELCAHPGCIAGVRAGLGCVWAQRGWRAAVLRRRAGSSCCGN